MHRKSFGNIEPKSIDHMLSRLAQHNFQRLGERKTIFICAPASPPYCSMYMEDSPQFFSCLRNGTETRKSIYFFRNNASVPCSLSPSDCLPRFPSLACNFSFHPFNSGIIPPSVWETFFLLLRCLLGQNETKVGMQWHHIATGISMNSEDGLLLTVE